MCFHGEPVIQAATQACRTDRALNIGAGSRPIENARQTGFDREVDEPFLQELGRHVEGQDRFGLTAGGIADDDPCLARARQDRNIVDLIRTRGHLLRMRLHVVDVDVEC